MEGSTRPELNTQRQHSLVNWSRQSPYRRRADCINNPARMDYIFTQHIARIERLTKCHPVDLA